MNGAEFLAEVIASGRVHGVGIGSSPAEVGRALRADFIDVHDDPDNLQLRRDYGLIEFCFTDGPQRRCTSISIQVHRLGPDPDQISQWRTAQQVDFPQYVAWDDVVEQLSADRDAPELVPSNQGEFIEYRAASAHVSVFVLNNHEERDEWPGHGDVWSVVLQSFEKA